MAEFREILATLSNEIGPSGHEKLVRAAIKA